MAEITVEASAATARRPWVLATLALAASALVLLFAIVPHGVYGDGYVRFLKLDKLLREGTLATERYSYIGPLFASPLWIFGDARLWWCARFNVLTLAAAVAGIWWATRSAAVADERATFVLLLVATGMMPNATLDFYGELFSAVAVGTGLLIVTLRGRGAGWIFVVLGVANMPASGGGLLLAAMWRFWRSRRIDGFVATALAVALILAENVVVRGTPLDGGYVRDRGLITVMPYSGMPGFSYPFIFGLVSQLLSFGKGLLFFAPGLLLVALARRTRPQLAPFFDLSITFVIGLVLVYSQWWAWYGGWTWGPRFLLYATFPSSLALAVALHAQASPARVIAAAAIALWTVWVGAAGAVFNLRGLDTCTANGYALEHLCWYVPDFSPLFRPLVLPPGPLVTWQKIWLLFAAVVAAMLVTSRSGPLKKEDQEPSAHSPSSDPPDRR
jgi:hypothetical protein